jgi:hypothetical protein
MGIPVPSPRQRLQTELERLVVELGWKEDASLPTRNKTPLLQVAVAGSTRVIHGGAVTYTRSGWRGCTPFAWCC